MNKIEAHKGICDKLNDTYRKKNSDYGDSFAIIRGKFPNAILIRLNDKLLRLEQLMTGAERQVKDESIEDTLLDLANYAIMELVERKRDPEKESFDNERFESGMIEGGVSIVLLKEVTESNREAKNSAEHFWEK